jgi:hypothetical protein
MANDALLPAALDISRKRGDTFMFTIVFNEGGSPKDFTGYTFKLAVNTDQKPSDASKQLFQLSDAITGDSSGNVNILVGTVEADQLPKTYYYELQGTDGAGLIRTLAAGKWVVVQDIVKAS